MINIELTSQEAELLKELLTFEIEKWHSNTSLAIMQNLLDKINKNDTR